MGTVSCEKLNLPLFFPMKTIFSERLDFVTVQQTAVVDVSAAHIVPLTKTQL